MKKYYKYKDSGIKWIGEIPEHWKINRVATMGTFSKGKGIPRSELKENGFPAILYGDIYTKYNIKADYIFNHIDEKITKSSVTIKKGDLLFTGSGETKEDIGKCIAYLGNETVCVGGDIIILKHNNNSLFLSYSLNSNNSIYQKASMAKGQIIVHIYASNLREISLPMPEQIEQTTIANFLDRKTAEIDNLISKKEKLLKLYDEEKTAIINTAVTKGINPNAKMKDSGVEWLGKIPEHWEVISLKRLVETKITDGPHETPTFLIDGVPFVSAEAVKNGEIDFNFKRGYISKDEDERFSKKCKPKRDDIFIVKSGSTTGKIAIVKTDINFNIWSPLALVRTNNKVTPKFIYFSLSSKYFQKTIQLFWSFGTQPNIGMNVIENLQVTIPISKEEQTAIVHHIKTETTRINSKITRTEKLIELLKEYKTALISEVVTGKICVL